MTKEDISKLLAAQPIRTDRSDNRTAEMLGNPADEVNAALAGKILTDAAVLVPLVAHEDGYTVLLTQRTDHLYHHPGQISFPGGRVEDSDADSVSAALREAEEETGLKPGQVEILGRLDDYVTITGFRVVPVVGLVHPPLALLPDPFEVADIFEVPLDFLSERSNYRSDFRVTPTGEKRHYYAVPYEGRYIWGATAGMLLNLCEVLGGRCAS